MAVEHITPGGGCLCCLEAVCERVDGVGAVGSGYSQAYGEFVVAPRVDQFRRTFRERVRET